MSKYQSVRGTRDLLPETKQVFRSIEAKAYKLAQERSDSPYLWLARGDVFLARKDAGAEECISRALEMTSGQWLFAWLAARMRMSKPSATRFSQTPRII